MKFRELINEDISNEAKDFMKSLNKQISFLKDEVKDSSYNRNWLVRLESIKILIEKQLNK